MKVTFHTVLLGAGALVLISLPAGSMAQEVPNLNAPRAAAVNSVLSSQPAEMIPADTNGARANDIFDRAADRKRIFPAANTAPAGFTDMPPIQTASEERPYAYMRFDGETAGQFPDALPLQAIIMNSEKLIVLNFIDERSRFSRMQSQVLQRTLTALAPRSTAKELMLVDVVVRDGEGNDFYMFTYSTYYDENNLGPDGTQREDAILPYGVVYGTPLREGSTDNTLFDFALMNGVQTDADLNANAESIAGSIYNLILNYNQKMAPGK